MTKKIFYKIGEACRKLDIQPYVLRYWETEFPELKPSKSRSGQRVYTEEELVLIKKIKALLYDDGFTIAGAKKKLEAAANGEGTLQTAEEIPAPREVQALRQGIEKALEDAKGILEILG